MRAYHTSSQMMKYAPYQKCICFSARRVRPLIFFPCVIAVWHMPPLICLLDTAFFLFHLTRFLMSLAIVVGYKMVSIVRWQMH